MKRKRLRRSAGFTLIEVAVAIAILGAGLATLVTLQTRLTDTFLRERNLFRATLAAQYLITFLEIENDPPEPGTSDGLLADALREKGYFDGDSLASPEERFADWRYVQDVESVDYAEFTDILRRIRLTIIWGEGSAEQHSLVLFMNTNKTAPTRAP